MTPRSEWVDLLAGRRHSIADVQLVAPLQQSVRGGSGLFLGLASDGRRYWIKPLNNGQGPRVPITEQIIGRAGAIIGAPTCQVRTVEIPDEIGRGNWKFRGDLDLQTGIAHGSLHVEGCVETRALEYRSQDDNRRRHCYILALHDWCWAGDGQWLRVEREDQRYYSHDHGSYLPPEGPVWNTGAIEQVIDDPHEMRNSNYTGFDLWSGVEVSRRLGEVTRGAILDVLAAIPREWPVTDEELETVGYFLERRAPQVAARLRTRLGVNP